MRYTFAGKNTHISDNFKKKAEQKINRLAKLLPKGVDSIEVSITLTKVKNDYKLEVSLPLHRRILRAETTGRDNYVALDAIVDILERQAVRYKERLRERSRRDVATREEITFIEEGVVAEAVEAEGIVIRRSKRVALKPMDAQEAIMNMDLLGHSFFVFRNDVTDEVNVVYKRNDGEYGLIESQ